MWVFPEYSRWCPIGTNTLPMHKTSIKTRGYGTDIFALAGDEDPNSKPLSFSLIILRPLDV
jgi:hypothetical protein